MNQLHDLLPLAVGMLISPLPIVAIVAIILAPRGRTAAPAYASVFIGVSLVFIVVGALTSAGSSSASPSGTAKTVSFILAIVLTLGFAALAIASWLSRPRHGQPPKAPAWLAALDSVTPAKAAALGLIMAVTNTKNIPLALKGGALIGEAHLPCSRQEGCASHWSSSVRCRSSSRSASRPAVQQPSRRHSSG